MAFENLFIRTEKSIGGIQLDAVISESHVNEVSLTSNPVELGADITDHAVVQPKKVNVLAQVSDTPLGVAALGQIVDSVSGFFGTSTTGNITRSEVAYNDMVRLQEARELLVLQTKLITYVNMVITNISVQQDKNTSRIVSMNISLQEVLITESETVPLLEEQLEAGSTTEQGSPADKTGRKETTDPNDATKSSVFKLIIDYAGSIFG